MTELHFVIFYQNWFNPEFRTLNIKKRTSQICCSQDFLKIVQLQSSYAYFGSYFHEENEWNDIVSKFHPILTDFKIGFFQNFVLIFQCFIWFLFHNTNLIVEIIYSLQIPLTTLWQTCYEYIASNIQATVQSRKLSFILSYVVCNFGCCREYSKWSHSSKL